METSGKTQRCHAQASNRICIESELAKHRHSLTALVIPRKELLHADAPLAPRICEVLVLLQRVRVMDDRLIEIVGADRKRPFGEAQHIACRALRILQQSPW